MTDPGSAVSTARRRALGWLGRIFLSLWGVGFVAVVVSFLRAPRTRLDRAGGERALRAGPLDDIPVGDGRLVRHGSRPLLVIRPQADHVVALSGICTHRRCVLRWDRERARVLCPCHSGAFDLNGNVLAGPPQEPLPQFDAEVRGGEILVHL